MLSDLDSGDADGDLIYKPGFSPKGRVRFSRLGLISVLSLDYPVNLMIQEAGLIRLPGDKMFL